MKLGGMPKFIEWTGLTAQQIKQRWLEEDCVVKYETGRMTNGEFANRIVSTWGLPIEPEEFLSELRSWASELYPGSIELLQQVRERRSIACLTNTNPIQWPRVRDELGLGIMFHHHFVSYEMGQVKPFREAYEYVVNDTRVPPSRILFFDDSEANVVAGREVGIHSYLVDDLSQIRDTLAAKGIVVQGAGGEEGGVVQ